jgi:hypothetical protein
MSYLKRRIRRICPIVTLADREVAFKKEIPNPNLKTYSPVYQEQEGILEALYVLHCSFQTIVS